MALMALTVMALMAPAALQRQVEAFAGQPALVDPRLLLPGCAQPEFGWGPGGRSVAVHCRAPEWRVFVPVAGGAADAPPPVVAMAPPPVATIAVVPVFRRGDRVSVEVAGAGFVIALDGVADSDARDGRVAVRPLSGGRRLNGIIDGEGRVRLH